MITPSELENRIGSAGEKYQFQTPIKGIRKDCYKKPLHVTARWYVQLAPNCAPSCWLIYCYCEYEDGFAVCCEDLKKYDQHIIQTELFENSEVNQ